MYCRTGQLSFSNSLIVKETLLIIKVIKKEKIICVYHAVLRKIELYVICFQEAELLGLSLVAWFFLNQLNLLYALFIAIVVLAVTNKIPNLAVRK